jgi:uncharacterized membrane protein
MQKIVFTDTTAQDLYINYLSSAENALAGLDGKDRNEILMEINSHIFEGFDSSGEGSETRRLLSVITELGDPYVYLKPVITEKKLNEAVKTFNPKKVLTVVYQKSKKSLAYTVFFLLYLFIIATASLLLFKIAFPAKTGLFYSGDKITGFGFLPNISGSTEVLHAWFYPIIVLAVLLMYLFTTLLLKFYRPNNTLAKIKN